MTEQVGGNVRRGSRSLLKCLIIFGVATALGMTTVSNTNADATTTGSTNQLAMTHVDKDNFLNYFNLNGSATYDTANGIVTMTTDSKDVVGGFELKSKIDMGTSFNLSGQVNLGNKVSSQMGADGIGFAFHNGNTTDIGNGGGNFGIGGLQDAVGFKLDTWHDNYGIPTVNKDGAQIPTTDSNGFGWSGDPDASQYPQYGAFVRTANQQITAVDGNAYQRWWATTDLGCSYVNNLDTIR